jgi:hypothetical protein
MGYIFPEIKTNTREPVTNKFKIILKEPALFPGSFPDCFRAISGLPDYFRALMEKGPLTHFTV